jgi:hypothetical protein
MATLAAGDVTTQLVIWLNANAATPDRQTKAKAALVTETLLPAATEITPLLKAFIAR